MTLRLARKEYKCNMCKGVIKPGTNYDRTAVLADGTVSTFKMCWECVFENGGTNPTFTDSDKAVARAEAYYERSL